MTVCTRHSGSFAAFWEMPDCEGIAISWLGQAGFALRAQGTRFLVDPYLSDALERKYRDSERSHRRMMPAPASVSGLAGLSWVFCTHAHGDHMDAETLPAIAGRIPECGFVIPRAHAAKASGLGIPDSRIRTIDAGESIDLGGGMSVRAIAAAHETIETDERGHHLHLGFVWRLNGMEIYHSGDCVPYAGLAGSVGSADLALLPVNGRGKGVPGNFTFAEASALCLEAGIPHWVPHHFGLFEFNTVERDQLEAAAALPDGPQALLPDTSSWFFLESENKQTRSP